MFKIANNTTVYSQKFFMSLLQLQSWQFLTLLGLSKMLIYREICNQWDYFGKMVIEVFKILSVGVAFDISSAK